MNKLPLISVVSINWNSPEDILHLLDSIENADYPKSILEVIVVDNASTDNSIKKIKNHFPKTKIVSLPKNIGSSAKNAGIKVAKGKYIFCIDSDVTISKDLFKKVVNKLNRDPNIGVLGVKVLAKKSHKTQPTCINYNFTTGVITPIKTNSSTHKCTYLPAIIHAFPKSLIKELGLYDNQHFFYGEDVDFCIRARKLGYKVFYFPETVVFHGKSKTTVNLPLSFRLPDYHKAVFQIVFRYGNIFQKIFVIPFQLLIIPLYRLLIQRENTFPQRLQGLWWFFAQSEKETKYFALILLLGLTLRILALNLHDFWFDEAFTYHLAIHPFSKLLQAVLTDNNPPLYYLLINTLLKFTSSEIVLRLPSLIFSMITIFLIYSLFAKANKKTGLIASSLFAFSPLSVYIATEARLHSMATMLFLATTLSFFSFLNKPNKKNSTIFIMLSTLSLYTQYYAALLFLPFFLLVINKRKPNLLKTFLVNSVITALLLSPWITASSLQLHNACSCPNSLISLPSSLVSPSLAGVGPVTLRSFTQLPSPILIFFALISLSTLLVFLIGLKVNISISAIYLLPLITLTISGLFLPVFSPKAFATFSPFFFMIAALGTKALKKNSYKLAIVFSLAFMLVVFTQIKLPFFHGENLKVFHNTIINKDPYSPVAHTSLVSYYSLHFYSQDRQEHLVITRNPLSAQTVRYIGGEKKSMGVNTQKAWLMDSAKWVYEDQYAPIIRALRLKYSFTKVLSKDNITLWYLHKK